MDRRSLPAGRVSRRGLVKASAIFGAMGAAPVLLRTTTAQTPSSVPVNTDVSGTLVEWGFGIQETNPLARSRVLAFQEAFPNVELEIVETFDQEQLLTAAASDTLPDVIWLGRFETAAWASRDVLMPLTDFIERDGYDTSMFYPWALEEATYEGQLYGIPGGADVRALFVNLNHLAEAGIDPELDTSDWDALSAAGEQLVQRSGDVVERWGFDHKMQAGYIWLWGQGNGGSFINEDGTEVTFDDPAVVEALEWGVQAYDAQGGFQDYQAISSTWQGDEQFARGEVSIAAYEQWMLSAAVATISPDMNFRVLPIRERGSGADGPMVTFSGGNAWYITTGAQNVDAAWEFIKFLHSVDTWMLAAQAVKQYRQETDAVYFPSLTGNIIADQRQIEEVYEPINEAFDAAVELFPQLVEASNYRQIAKSVVGGELDQIMQSEGVTPALSGERSAEEALAEADTIAQEEIDFA
jgi:multiple sugar transport system substrate-binding protein